MRDSGNLDDCQHSFLKENTTNSVVIDFADNLMADINYITISLYVDFFNAFDTVNHKNLLKTLDGMETRGACNKLLQTYLNNRKQYVHVKGESSGLATVLTEYHRD